MQSAALRKMLWFVGLWCAGVTAMAVVAWILRLALV
jgi:hypothetical protein